VTGTITSLKDPKMAAVYQMLEAKKVTQIMESDHKPVIGAATGGNFTADKIKRTVMQGGTSAPLKFKTSVIPMKLKTNQIAFKTTETKVVKKE